MNWKLQNNVGADHHVRPNIGPDNNQNNKKGQAQWSAPTIKIKSLSKIIKQFKTFVTKIYIDGVRDKSWNPFYKKLWQRNFYERIIRDMIELDKIRKYIKENPINWEIDDNYKEKHDKFKCL